LGTPDIIYTQYKKYVNIWPEPFETQMKQIIEVTFLCLLDKIHDFIDILDALPQHTTVTRTKQQFNLVAFGIVTVGLAMYNAVQIPKLENKINTSEKKVDHLIDITNLHEQHFKAVDQKIDDISNQLTTMLQVNKAHFTKTTDLMEPKLRAAVAIS
jgi:hypothetical protein